MKMTECKNDVYWSCCTANEARYFQPYGTFRTDRHCHPALRGQQLLEKPTCPFGQVLEINTCPKKYEPAQRPNFFVQTLNIYAVSIIFWKQSLHSFVMTRNGEIYQWTSSFDEVFYLLSGQLLQLFHLPDGQFYLPRAIGPMELLTPGSYLDTCKL